MRQSTELFFRPWVPWLLLWPLRYRTVAYLALAPFGRDDSFARRYFLVKEAAGGRSKMYVTRIGNGVRRETERSVFKRPLIDEVFS